MPINSYENTITVLLYALKASKIAGDEILDVYTSDFTIEKKDDTSPITLADKRSHQAIVNQLAELTIHNLPVLSEEGRNIPYAERLQWDNFWLIDPLDGTKEFINRNDEFTVNIALIHKDRPVLGVIYIPVRDIYYFGASGIGAYKIEKSETAELLNKKVAHDINAESFDRLIERSTRLPAGKSNKLQHNRITIIGSRSHMSKDTEEYIYALKEKNIEIDFVSAGSSLKFCLVAEGKADVYPRFGPTMEWDTAAGQIIVEQAGGKVVSVETNEPMRYNKESLKNPFFIATKTDMIL